MTRIDVSTLLRFRHLLLFFTSLLIMFYAIDWVLSNSVRRTRLTLASIDCGRIFEGDTEEMERAITVRFNQTPFNEEFKKAEYKCEFLRSTLNFFDRPLSEEERSYPLAYGMLIHSDFLQLGLILSAIYQPQNQFCLAVDGNSKDEFYEQVKQLAACYDNIHVMRVGVIEWCGYEIITSVFGCVEYLAGLKSDWRYFQYLSGVDAPLRTNLEMVRVMKALNGSFNAEILPFERYRLAWKKASDSPLPIVKSSLSAVFSRESANFMASNEVVRDQLDFLNGTLCADESLWSTIAGNPDKLSMPGAFNASAYLEGLLKNHTSVFPNRADYYISRYQVFVTRHNRECYGYFYRDSCVFGVYDLPTLIRRPELVAHKLYTSFQPAAFMCLIQESRRRSLNPSPFDASYYENLSGAPPRMF